MAENISDIKRSIEQKTTTNKYLQRSLVFLGIASAIVGAWSNMVSTDKDDLQKLEDDRKDTELSNVAASNRKIEAEAAKDRLTAEQLRESNLKLQQIVEEERTARLNLEKQISPRRLTGAAKGKLISVLRKHPAGVIKFQCSTAPEVLDFTRDIVLAFQEAGWTVNTDGVGAVFVGSTPLRGFAMGIQRGTESVADLVSNALSAAGILLYALPVNYMDGAGNEIPVLAVGDKMAFETTTPGKLIMNDPVSKGNIGKPPAGK